jgi:hypothetical protein
MSAYIKYPNAIRSVVESGCAEDGAAAEGVVKGVQDNSGEYCKGSKAGIGIPSGSLIGDWKIPKESVCKGE